MSGPVLTKIFGSSPQIEAMSVVKAKIRENSEERASLTKFSSVESLRKKGLYNEYCNIMGTLHQIDAIEITNTKLGSKLATLNGIVENLRSVAVEIRQHAMESSAMTSGVDIRELAEKNLKIVALTLNATSASGVGYEFGGAYTNIAPVEDVDAFVRDSNIVDGKVTANYTKVIPADTVSRIDLTRTLEVGIDATNPAFQKLIGALHILRGCSPSNSKDEAIKLLDESVKELDGLVVTIGFNERILDDAKGSLNSAKMNAVTDFENNFKSDIPALLAESTELDTQLQSALSALAKGISGPSLLDFLR